MTDKETKLSAQAMVKDLKPYRKPTLVRGPALSKITAVDNGIGVSIKKAGV